MKIDLHKITIGDLVNGYQDNGNKGVVGYGGLLDIRPPYQREFIYDNNKRNAVINTVYRGLPLNVMYWAKVDDSFELMDGQQRTISIGSYVNGDFSVDAKYFHSLTKDEQKEMLAYELMVYQCEGNDKEKLAWFETINIAGEKLTRQELRNAIYVGPWVADAKKHFSRHGCPAYAIGDDYIKAVPIRQELLEKAINGISPNHVAQYMADHQYDPTCLELWTYYQSVISWIKSTFPTIRKKEMHKVDWFKLYNDCHSKMLDPVALEDEIKTLMKDDEVQKKSGVYDYVLRRDERFLNLRPFTDEQKRAAYERQDGVCAHCDKKCDDLSAMEGDHITPWSKGGKTTPDNLQMLCVACNRRKGAK